MIKHTLFDNKCESEFIFNNLCTVDEIILESNNVSKKIKSEKDIITSLDTKIGYYFRDCIETSYSGCNFYAEDTPQIYKSSNKFNWIVDPIDGSINLYKKFPFSSTSIAYTNQHPIIGGILLHQTSEIIISDGKLIQSSDNIEYSCSQVKSLSQAVISVAISPSMSSYQLEHSIRIIERLSQSCLGVRIIGSDVFALSQVSKGYLDGHISVSGDVYGVVATALLVKASGAVITNGNGEKIGLERNSRIASSPIIHNELIEIFTSTAL